MFWIVAGAPAGVVLLNVVPGACPPDVDDDEPPPGYPGAGAAAIQASAHSSRLGGAVAGLTAVGAAAGAVPGFH